MKANSPQLCNILASRGCCVLLKYAMSIVIHIFTKILKRIFGLQEYFSITYDPDYLECIGLSWCIASLMITYHMTFN